MSDGMGLRRITVTSLPVFLATTDLAWIVTMTALVHGATSQGARAFLEAGGLVGTCALLSAYAMGLYEQRYFTARRLLPRALFTLLLTAGALSVSTMMPTNDLPRSLSQVGVLSLAAVLGLLPVRVLWPRLVETSLMRRRIAVFGSPQDVSAVRQIQALSPRSAFACVATRAEAPTKGEPLFQPGVDEIVVGDQEPYFGDRSVFRQRLSGASVIGLGSFIERECHVIDLLGAEAKRAALWRRRPAASRAAKRAVDVMASVVIFVFVLPVLVATAVAVWFVDRGPIFYRQTRIGAGGRLFELIKFRTMRVDAEADGIPRWAEFGDRRVTRIGGFLRRSRIDELPQLLNILHGDMSLVGPRPERPEFVRQIADQAPQYECRHFVTPGVTGWAQVNFPYGASIQQNIVKASYDLYYVKHSSTVLDVKILLKTIRVILLAEGSR